MTRRLLIGATTLAFGFVGGSWVAAQQGTLWVPRQADFTRQPVQVKPLVVSGADIGFRIDARRGLTPIGKLVIRMDGGPWLDAEYTTPEITAQLTGTPR
jgi:hypothetical protein